MHYLDEEGHRKLSEIVAKRKSKGIDIQKVKEISKQRVRVMLGMKDDKRAQVFVDDDLLLVHLFCRNCEHEVAVQALYKAIKDGMKCDVCEAEGETLRPVLGLDAVKLYA